MICELEMCWTNNASSQRQGWIKRLVNFLPRNLFNLLFILCLKERKSLNLDCTVWYISTWVVMCSTVLRRQFLFCNLPGLYYVVLCTWIIMGFNFYLNCSALSISTWLCYLPWLCYVVLSTWIVMGFNFYLNCTWLPISTITVHSISTFIALFG